MKRIYLDHAATTPLDEKVLEAMLPYLKEYYGNSSSIYQEGRECRRAIEEAREKVARAIHCEPHEIYFTASGSEGDNTAIRGIAKAYQQKGNHIITSQIEHPAVLETCKELEHEGFEVSYIHVNEKGIVDIDELKRCIRPTTILISVMFANNELGTIQPMKEIGEIAHQQGILFHTDAVQAVGALPIHVKELQIDSLTLSAHKFYGPKGVGALYVRKGVNFEKLIQGGHQERNKRAGTENVSGIVGLGKAIELAYEILEENNRKIMELRDYFVAQIEDKIPEIILNGDREKRLPGNCNISFPFLHGESLLFNLDLKGISASSGSACTSGSLEPSHVLLAIGLAQDIARGSLRISIGKENTKEELEEVIKQIIEIVNRLRKV